jgi:hypothetical protein
LRDTSRKRAEQEKPCDPVRFVEHGGMLESVNRGHAVVVDEGG